MAKWPEGTQEKLLSAYFLIQYGVSKSEPNSAVAVSAKKLMASLKEAYEKI
jgi:hypothetical protein